LTNNLQAISNLHTQLSGVSIDLVNQLNDHCNQAAQLYQAKRYQEIVSMTLSIWLDSSDTYLKLSTCRQSVQDLAVSLGALKMFSEQEAVQRRVVNLNLSRMDNGQYFSWIDLGDNALRKNDWLEAGKDYAIANSISLVISNTSPYVNRIRIWNKMASFVDTCAKGKPLTDFVSVIQTGFQDFEYKQGLWIQIGLAYEHLNRYQDALAAYQNALHEESNDPYLTEHVQKITKLIP